MKWEVVYTKQAQKDARILLRSGLKNQAQKLLDIIAKDPFQKPPPFEKLTGNLSGAYSRRINIQHRLVYEIIQDKRVVKVIRMWTHYE